MAASNTPSFDRQPAYMGRLPHLSQEVQSPLPEIDDRLIEQARKTGSHVVDAAKFGVIFGQNYYFERQVPLEPRQPTAREHFQDTLL